MQTKLKERMASLISDVAKYLPKEQKSLAQDIQRCFGEIRQEHSALKRQCEESENAKTSLTKKIAEERKRVDAAQAATREVTAELEQERKKQKHVEESLQKLQSEVDPSNSNDVLGFHLMAGEQMVGTMILANQMWPLPCLFRINARRLNDANQLILTMPDDADRMWAAMNHLERNMDTLFEQED